jgi:hypothetical protein
MANFLAQNLGLYINYDIKLWFGQSVKPQLNIILF